MTNRAVLTLLLASEAALMSGCSRGPGQMVVGIVTDMTWPDPLSSLRVQVFRSDDRSDAAVPVGEEEVIALGSKRGLPGTYVVQSDGQPARIEVTALDSGNNQLLTRAVAFPIAAGEVQFLRIALVKACVGNASCNMMQTCVEGRCVSPLAGSDDIVPYAPDLVTTLDCTDAATLLDTTNGVPMMARGTGSCPSGRACSEGTCRPASTAR